MGPDCQQLKRYLEAHFDRRCAERHAGFVLLPVLVAIVIVAALATAWFWFFLTWNYSTGERAGPPAARDPAAPAALS